MQYDKFDFIKNCGIYVMNFIPGMDDFAKN